MKRFYEPLYRFMATFRIPKAWVFGSGERRLDELLDAHQLQPGTAIDLGCGVGAEAIHLARRGLSVTGVDGSETAIKLARRQARSAGIHVEFVLADLTQPLPIRGPFDLLVDLGTLNDIAAAERDGYVENVTSLARPGSLFLLFGFEKALPQREREARFGATFTLETLDERVEPLFRRRMITSLLTRK